MHAPVAHDDAVAHADGRHHHRGAAGGVDTGFHRLCQLIQMGMSGDDVALGGYHADQGLLQLLVREARGVKQGPVRRPVRALCHLIADHIETSIHSMTC